MKFSHIRRFAAAVLLLALLAGQALAVKMWNGNDETEYTDDEVKIIKELVERTTAPCFIDAVNAAISNAVAVNESK